MTELLPRPGTGLDTGNDARTDVKLGGGLDEGVDEGFDEDLVCREVVAVTHDVTSFVLASPRGRRFAFRPGQYVTVTATVAGQRIERCYTISSSPSDTDRLTITVKRVPGGPMSNWLHDRLAPGGGLRVSGPLGRFSTHDHPASKYLFLSAGSGVTPVMSMTRALRDDPAADIVFVHSARAPRDIIFRAELDALVAARPGVRVAAVCEGDDAVERWDGARGRLTPALLAGFAPDLHEREVFVCGPRPYRDAVREMLRQAGVDPARCHQESFTLGEASASAGPAAIPPAGSSTTRSATTLEFRRSGRVVTCEPGETVLQAGLRAGVALPSSCGEGLCGTCKHTVVSGTVDMQHNGGIRPREIANGEILLCCSRPLDDLVLDA